MVKEYCRTIKGKRCYFKTTDNKVFRKYTLLMAISTKGVVAYKFYEKGGSNKDRFSDVLTAVIVPDNKDADQLRKVILENFNMSLGNGLSKLKGKVFRIGHLGDLSDLSLLGTLSGVEMGLDLMSIPFQRGGVEKAREYLKDNL